MLLFTVLLAILVLLAFVSVFLLSVGGTFFIVIFADVLVCAFIIIGIMKALTRKKK